MNERKKNKTNAVLLLFLFLLFGTGLTGQERFRRVPPSPGSLPELTLPSFENHTLANDLTLTVVRRPNTSLASLRLIIAAGENISPDNLPGLATFTAKMLEKGTQTLSPSELEEQIAATGGSISTLVNPEHTVLSMTFLQEYLDEAMEILGQIILKPAFSQREITSTKTELFYDMFGRRNDSQFIAKRLLLRTLFKDSPYEKYTFNEDIIKNITRDDIVNFFDQFYRPNNSRMVIVGDISLQSASRTVSRHLNTWKPSDVKYFAADMPRPSKRPKICLIDQPQAKEVTLFVGNIIAPYSPKEFFPYQVFNMVFGGTLNSRIFMNLRESKGYAYGAFSQVDFYRQFGLFMVESVVRPEYLNISIRETLREINRIMVNRIPSDEIEPAKSYIIGNFSLQLEEIDTFASKVAEIVTYDLGDAHWMGYVKNIAQVESSQVFNLMKNQAFMTPVIVIIADVELEQDPELDPDPILTKLTEEFGEVEIYNYKGILQYTMK